ncbi:unnamed protein product [Cyprideis torosa]|uniref:Uncharacterized protein n=1 Tax=Cyprideis torosa TaxID=163714 RepID=A0A7R8WGI0_9CRUS|nr:unnamed protein product [Cyprideis torosa]CAG0898188.1 unnamed protein product [Cyprideis torosa]
MDSIQATAEGRPGAVGGSSYIAAPRLRKGGRFTATWLDFSSSHNTTTEQRHTQHAHALSPGRRRTDQGSSLPRWNQDSLVTLQSEPTDPRKRPRAWDAITERRLLAIMASATRAIEAFTSHTRRWESTSGVSKPASSFAFFLLRRTSTQGRQASILRSFLRAEHLWTEERNGRGHITCFGSLSRPAYSSQQKPGLSLSVNRNSFNATCCKFLLSAGDRRTTINLCDGNFHRSHEQTLEAPEPPPNIIPCNCHHHVSRFPLSKPTWLVFHAKPRGRLRAIISPEEGTTRYPLPCAVPPNLQTVLNQSLDFGTRRTWITIDQIGELQHGLKVQRGELWEAVVMGFTPGKTVVDVSNHTRDAHGSLATPRQCKIADGYAGKEITETGPRIFNSIIGENFGNGSGDGTLREFHPQPINEVENLVEHGDRWNHRKAHPVLRLEVVAMSFRRLRSWFRRVFQAPSPALSWSPDADFSNVGEQQEPVTLHESGNLSTAGMSSSNLDPEFSAVGQEQEAGQRPAFTLTRHQGSSEVELRTRDGVALSLPLVSRGDFTLYEYGWTTFDFRTVPPSISFLLSPDPLSSDEDSESESNDPPSPDERRGATAHGSLSFDHGKVKKRITVTYQLIGTKEVTMTWLHLFARLPGYHPVVKLLLHHGADPKAVTSPLNRTPLHLAATGETATVLMDNGAQVNVRDVWGQTPLHLASERDRHSTAHVLLSNGADPNIPDFDEQTPLHLASRDGHHSIVDLLLAHGADPNIADSSKQTPLHLAFERGHHSTAQVLLSHGADPNIADSLEQTPLHNASERGHHSIVDLMAHGPLSYAKTEELMLTMIGYTKDLNRQDHQTGNTLLHSCCERGYEEAAKRLLEKGVRIDLKNIKAETALDIARAKGYAHIASHFPGHLQTGRFEREFEVFKDDKHKDGVLGKGAFGRVFKAKRRGTDDVFAIKEIPFPPEDAEKTLREVRAAMELSREHPSILTHHDAWLEDRRTSDEGSTSTQSGDGAGPAEVLPSSSGSRADIDPRKGRSGEESSQSSSSPEEERSDDIAGGHSGREELQQENRSQTATIEEGESSQRPSASAAEGRDGGVRLPQGRDQRFQSQDESCGEEGSESPSCTDEESDDGIVFENSREETGRSNQSQQRETSGEEGSSNRPPSLAGESDDDVIFQDSEPGQDSDQDESSAEGDFSECSSPSQEGSDDGIMFEETETGRNDPSQDESSSCSQEYSDDGIRFEETEETGRNSRTQDESSESSSPSQEESDGGIRFQKTGEIGRKNRSQDAISINEEESRQDNQRSPPRGNEEESDEVGTIKQFVEIVRSVGIEVLLRLTYANNPPTRSSAQGDGSEGVWTSGAEGGSSTAAEEYLRKCTLTLYIQMDLMEMTLEDYIRRRNEGYLEKSSALSEEDRRTAWGIFWDLCWAVEFVHERGFIHRDLKPSNVLLSPKENPDDSSSSSDDNECPYSVRLSDFGLSTRLVDEFGAGMYKTVGCGTVSYAAPEQLKGGPGSTSKGAKYGKGVDIYSLALIAVELCVPMSISERPRVFDGLRSPQVRIPQELEESLGQRLLEKKHLCHQECAPVATPPPNSQSLPSKRLTRWFLGLWSVGGSASGGLSGMGLVPGLVSAATDDDGGREKGLSRDGKRFSFTASNIPGSETS